MAAAANFACRETFSSGSHRNSFTETYSAITAPATSAISSGPTVQVEVEPMNVYWRPTTRCVAGRNTLRRCNHSGKNTKGNVAPEKNRNRNQMALLITCVS